MNVKFTIRPPQPPTEKQIKLLKQIYNKELQVANSISAWKHINLLEKKGLIKADDNDNWVITEKGKGYL